MLDEEQKAAQIKEIMAGALLKTSKKKQIHLKDLRIKMTLNESHTDVECYALNKEEEIEQVRWSSILGLKIAFKGLIIENLLSTFARLSSEQQIELNDLNIRVFAADNKGTAKSYLYNGIKPATPLEVEALI